MRAGKRLGYRRTSGVAYLNKFPLEVASTFESPKMKFDATSRFKYSFTPQALSPTLSQGEREKYRRSAANNGFMSPLQRFEICPAGNLGRCPRVLHSAPLVLISFSTKSLTFRAAGNYRPACLNNAGFLTSFLQNLQSVPSDDW